MTGRLRVRKLAHVVKPRASPAPATNAEVEEEASGSAAAKDAGKEGFLNTRSSSKESSTSSKAERDLFGTYANFPTCTASFEEREQCAGHLVVALCGDLQTWAEDTLVDGISLAEDGNLLWRGLLARYETHSASTKSALISRLFNLSMASDTVVRYDNVVSDMNRIFATLERMDFCLKDLRFILLAAATPSRYRETLNSAEMNGVSTDDVVQKTREQVARNATTGGIANLFSGKSRTGDDAPKCTFPGCGMKGHLRHQCFRNPESDRYKGEEFVKDAKERDAKRKSSAGKGASAQTVAVDDTAGGLEDVWEALFP
jgi:hypothetical protein